MTNQKYSIQLKNLLSNIVEIEEHDDRELFAITNDSRQVHKGSIFLAYPGYTVDGRQFIDQAIAKNAAAILYESSDKIKITPQKNVPIFPISNLSALQGELAARFYQHPSQQMKIIGVTGTNGKTSITHFIAETLNPEYPCAVIGTTGLGFLPNLQHTFFTTSDAVTLQKQLAQLKDQGAKAVSMEVSSHALSQNRVNGVNFYIAIYTQLSRDHLDFHLDMENYAKAKAKLFSMPGIQYRIINQDDPWGEQLIEKYQSYPGLIAYSLRDQPSNHYDKVYAKRIKKMKFGYQVDVVTPWGEGTFDSPLLGEFNISNLLAVLSTLLIFNIPFKQALERISKLSPPPGRLQCFGGNGSLPLIINDYSHTPDALAKVLITLRQHGQGKLWCVFGCGGNRDKGKRPEMGRIAEQYSDKVVITNDNPRNESPEAIVEDICKGLKHSEAVKILLNRHEAIKYAVQSAGINDIVLIAGKGHETTQTIGDQVIHFSDQEQIERQLEIRSNEEK